MKLLLVVLIFIFGCTNQKEYDAGYEVGTMNCIEYYMCKGEYPNYWIRQHLKKDRIELPSDCEYIDSIINHYTKKYLMK